MSNPFFIILQLKSGIIPTYSIPLTCSVVCHSLGKHGFATSRGAIHQHSTRRVNANLLVELEVSEGQLHSLPHFLLLDVHSTLE